MATPSTAAFLAELEDCRNSWEALLKLLGSNREDVELEYIELFQDWRAGEPIGHGPRSLARIELGEVVPLVLDLISRLQENLIARSGWSPAHERRRQ